MNFWVILEKATYKKNKFKVQLVQNEPKLTEWTELGQVDLIGLNKNCLIFRKNKLSSQIIENNLYIIIKLQNNYLFPHSHGSATNYDKIWHIYGWIFYRCTIFSCLYINLFGIWICKPLFKDFKRILLCGQIIIPKFLRK